MSSLLNIMAASPMQGALLDTNPRGAPPSSALRLENIRVWGGLSRSRFGYTGLNGAAFDSKRVIDLFDRTFADGTSETLRCVRDTTERSASGAWSAVTLDSAWTGADSNRFWCVPIPFGAEAKGRLAIGNGADILKTWTGTAGTMTAYPGGFASKTGIVGDDGRLFIANTIETGTVYIQRVRWTVIGLANGNSTDWSGTGSGAIDLRRDSWPITTLWKQSGRLYVGKTRGIAILAPTGIATDAYGDETLQTNGEGVFCAGSLVQYGNLAAFVSHRDIIVFDGATLSGILGENRQTFQQRFNKAAADQVTSVVDARNNRIGWGLPLDGATTPTEIWWYEIDSGHWEMDLIPHSALTLSTSVSAITIDQLTGTIDALTGTIDSLGGTGIAEPRVIMGSTTGATYIFDNTTKTDNGALIGSVYVSPGFVPIGKEVIVGGRSHIIDEDDYLIIDEVSVRFLDRGDTYMATVEVSGDGGYSWTTMGTVTVASAGGTDLRPRFVRQFVTGRIPVKDTAQVRLTNSTTGILWGWSDITLFFDISGEKKT